jgi:cytochrome c-type biogenesis protein CcsB
MKRWIPRLFPWAVFAVFAAEIAAILMPKPDRDLRIQDFGRLPVLLNGRVQPFDSVGRNALLQIRGTASVPLVEKKSYEFWKHPPKLKATEWLMEVMMKPEQADERHVFLVHHPDLLNEFNLRGKGKEKSGLFYFTYHELEPSLEAIDKQGRQVAGIESAHRTAYDRQVAKLHNALILYQRLKQSLQPSDSQDFARELGEFEQAIAPGIAAFKAREAKQDFDSVALQRYFGLVSRFDQMARLAYPLVVPPAQPASARDDWRNMGRVLFEAGVHGAPLPPAVGWFARMSSAFRQNNAAAFNQVVTEYRQWLQGALAPEVQKGRREFFFNNLQPFLHAMIIYLCAFLLAAGAMATLSLWPAGADTLRRSALYLIALAWVVHTAGLVFRMVLERRPPVTNLYSSAIFIGWMSVLLGVILERLYRVGIGAAAASLVGFITLIIAHNLALGGDTMEMLRAVLDTNFWLATHVVTITLGYAANFVAGFLGIAFILVGVLTPILAMKAGGPSSGIQPPAPGTRPAGADGSPDIGQALVKMVYGIICFATLFSFVGTVLGGIWADQSWGRFWGWDPKENGALIIVLWNGLILHARWGGLIRERGLMNLAIFGNIVTAFSWFGVNMLGIGLHSYGFMDQAFRWLVLFVASQIGIMALGCLPLKYWSSFRASDASGPPPPPPGSACEEAVSSPSRPTTASA